MFEIIIEFSKSYKHFPVNENIIKTGKIIKELEYKGIHDNMINRDFERIYINHITKKDFKELLDKMFENDVKYHNIIIFPK